MNHDEVVAEYGEEIAEFVTDRIEEDLGINGYDLFVCDGLPEPMINDIVGDFFCKDC